MNDAAVCADARMVENLAQLAAADDCGDVLRVVLAVPRDEFPITALDLIRGSEANSPPVSLRRKKCCGARCWDASCAIARVALVVNAGKDIRFWC